ncbi:alpha/beta hydrolase [Candidatus Kaiserbacteria bacterium]|nr:alpha/beta hydrolase [Candidatus Kaiserbacteria bacterium]
MKKKRQILMIHGGMTFKNDKDYVHWLKTRKVSTKKRPYWEADLEDKLGKKFEIIRPRMPLQDNAKYRDWKIWFERHLPLLRNNFILIGSSLGGIFLAKYLSEHKLSKRVLSVYLVCTPFDGSLPTEDLVGGFKLKTNISLIERNCKNLHIFFSKDDDIVPVSHAEKYRKKLKKAHIVIYKNKKGHFTAPTFPEIIKMIKIDTR